MNIRLAIRRSLSICAAAGFLAAPARAIADSPPEPVDVLPTRPEQLQFKALEFHPRPPETRTLANGARLVLVADESWPGVVLTARFRAGALCDPEDLPGLAASVAATLRPASFASAEAFRLYLDERAILFTAAAEPSSFVVRVDAPPGVLDDALALFADAIARPAAAMLDAETRRFRWIEELRRRDDNAAAVADREFAKLVLGADAPWTREAFPEHVAALAAERLAAFHSAWLRPDNAVIGAAGNFDAEALAASLKERFAGWEPGAAAFPELQPPAPPKRGLYYIDRPGAPNVEIRIGHLGAPPQAPDHYAIAAINRLYGSVDLGSRLSRRLRGERALTYDARGAIGLDEGAGIFRNSLATRPESAAEAVRALAGEIRRLATEPIPPAELAAAQDASANGFVFAYATSGELMENAVRFASRGEPDDYLPTYLERLLAVTSEEATACAAERVDPEALVVLVVGDASRFLDDLSPERLGLDLGPPLRIDLPDFSGARLPETDEKAPPIDENGGPVVSIHVRARRP